MRDDWHGLSSVIAGLDPAIHLLCKTLFRSGWTRGSSPRVTPENGQAPSQYEREPILVSRFRSSHHYAARSLANFGIKGTLAIYDSSAVFGFEVPKQTRGYNDKELQIHRTSCRCRTGRRSLAAAARQRPSHASRNLRHVPDRVVDVGLAHRDRVHFAAMR
jgi:hypothetical protein